MGVMQNLANANIQTQQKKQLELAQKQIDLLEQVIKLLQSKEQ